VKTKDRFSISLSKELMEDIEDMLREYNYKNKCNLSKSEFIEKLIRLGIRAKRDGLFLDL